MADDVAAWTAGDEYFATVLGRPDAALGRSLDGALAASDAAGLPAISVSYLQGKMLALLVRATGARRVLEIGTLGGYSTIWLASALPAGGEVVTCELAEHHADVAAANLAAAGLSERVTIRRGPAGATLAELAAAGVEPFDLVFIDADKPGYAGYLRGVLPLARPGTLIVADNVVRGGRVAGGDDEPNAAGIREFLAQVAGTPSLSATVVQTVGAKGHDGFLLAVVGG